MKKKPKLKRFAFSTCCQRIMNGRQEIRHSVGVVEAADEDSAFGQAWRIARINYPPDDGWFMFNVITQSADFVVTPETAQIVK